MLGHPQHAGPDAELDASTGILHLVDRPLLAATEVPLRRPQDLDEQLLLRVEVPVEDALADTEAVDDVGDRRGVVPIGREPLRGVGDQLGTAFLAT